MEMSCIVRNEMTKMQVERSSLKFMLSFFQVMNGRKDTKPIFGDID